MYPTPCRSAIGGLAVYPVPCRSAIGGLAVYLVARVALRCRETRRKRPFLPGFAHPKRLHGTFRYTRSDPVARNTPQGSPRHVPLHRKGVHAIARFRKPEAKSWMHRAERVMPIALPGTCLRIRLNGNSHRVVRSRCVQRQSKLLSKRATPLPCRFRARTLAFSGEPCKLLAKRGEPHLIHDDV